VTVNTQSFHTFATCSAQNIIIKQNSCLRIYYIFTYNNACLIARNQKVPDTL